MKVAPAIVAIGILLAACTNEEASPPTLWTAEPGLVFCYSTLADPDCAPAAEPGAEQRLIAVAPDLIFIPIPPAAGSDGSIVLVQPEGK